jgi:hypothetical protein
MGISSVLGKRRTVTVLVAVLGLLVGGSAVALAVGTPTTATGAGVTAIKVVRGGNPIQSSSTTFVDAAGVTTSISVPAGTKGLLDIRFEATTVCTATNPALETASCFVKVVVDNTEAEPSGLNSSNIAVMDSVAVSPVAFSAYHQAHAIERSIVAGPGPHTVKLQISVANPDITFALSNWHFTVERFRV